MRPFIIAFCKTNLALLAETERLFAEATVLAQSSGDDAVVRVIRCLTKCHSCGEVPYVKVGDQILTQPSIEQLRDAIAARPKPVPKFGGPAECISPIQPNDVEGLSTQGKLWQP